MQSLPRSNFVWFLPHGSVGESLMVAAWYNDLLATIPDARLTILVLDHAGITSGVFAGYSTTTVIAVPRNPLKRVGLFISLFSKRAAFIAHPQLFQNYWFQFKLFFSLVGLRPGNLTIGFSDKTGYRPYHCTLDYDFLIPFLDNLRKTLPLVGVPLPQGAPRVSLTRTQPAFDFARKPYIALHMFSRATRRNLPLKRWRHLAALLARTFPTYPIALTGTLEDAAEIGTLFDDIPNVHKTFGTTVTELNALVGGAALYLGPDTGVSHVAAMLGVPSVVVGNLVCPSWLQDYNPNGIVLTNSARCNCSGDYLRECSVEVDGVNYLRCMYDIPDEQILEEAQLILGKGAARHDAIPGQSTDLFANARLALQERLLAGMERPVELALEFDEQYGGAGLRARLKRLMRYPHTYGLLALARITGLHIRYPARLYFGNHLFVNANDLEAFQLSAFGILSPAYEQALIRYLIRTLKSGDVFYDVGANYGFYTALALKLVGRGEVHVFEPLPQVFACIERSFGDMRAAILNQAALSEIEGEATIYSPVGMSGKSSLIADVPDSYSNVDAPWEAESIRAIRLDKYAAAHRAPSVIKLDCEGAEKLVIAGGIETLRTHRPIVILEVWGGSRGATFSREATEMLQALNYTAHRISEDGTLVPVAQDFFISLGSTPDSVHNMVFQ